MKQTFNVPEGTTKVTIEQVGNQIITTFESKSKFKEGDFIFSNHTEANNGYCVGIYKNERSYIAYYFIAYKLLRIDDNFEWYSRKDIRLATEEEKQTLLDAMHPRGKDWDAEKCEVVDYVEKIKAGQKYCLIYLCNGYFMYRVVQNTLNRAVDYDFVDFKTEELAQEACDKLNETLKTLKYY